MKVASNRSFIVSGYVNTSHGKVTTTISEDLTFTQYQVFNITNTEYLQQIQKSVRIHSTTLGNPRTTEPHLSTKNCQFPLILDIDEIRAHPTATSTRPPRPAKPTATSKFHEAKLCPIRQQGRLTNTPYVRTRSTFDSNFNLIGNIDQSASQTYNQQQDSPHVNYLCTITAASNALTSFLPACSQ